MLRHPLHTALVLALGATAAGHALAAGAAQDPYSPRNGHAYRHGVIANLNVHAAMQRWEKAHAQVANAKTLSFGGGTGGVGVMSGQNKVYLVFYGTQWGTSSTDANGNLKFTNDTAGAAGAAQQMFKGIGTNSELWQADLTQWCDGPAIASGATSCPLQQTGTYNRVVYQHNILAGVWYDNTKASPAAATAAQLANEAIAAAAHFGNTTAASNRSAYYVILSPKGTNPDNYQGSYCAWHDYTADAGVTSPYGEMAFSNQPYNLDSGAGCGVNFVNAGAAGTLDGWTMTLGHEWHEMMSDQFPSGGWTNHNTGTYAGQENSDECAWIAAGSAGGAANITFSTGTFAEQASYSNDTAACAISHVIVSPNDAPPVANFTTTTSGLTANFTDASQDSLGTITQYNWNFGDGATSTVKNPSHTYAAAGTYTVSETIIDSVGANASTSHAVTVSGANQPPTANFSATVSAYTATFTDSSTDTDGTIVAHAWNFGDGTTSTATSPTHTYSAAGSYTVTETVTDNGGATASKTLSVSTNPGEPQFLFSNTGFEAAGTWTASSGVLCTTGCSGQSAHAGTGFAWLNGYGAKHTDTLSQQANAVLLPGTVTLQFYLHIDTAETSTTTAYDKLAVGVYSSTGALLKTLATFSNLNKNTGYALHSYDLSPYVGQKVTVKFTGTEDASLQTSFVIDDVTLIDYAH